MENVFQKRVSDTDKNLQSQGGNIRFGLNIGKITKLAFTDKAGANESPGDAVDVVVNVGGKEINSRLFDIKKVYGANSVVLTPGDDGYEVAYAKEMNQLMGTVIHYIKATGVQQESIDAVVQAAKPTTFAMWAKTVLGLLPNDFSTKPVDVFLHYGTKIPLGYEKAFLELPRNMKTGYFIIPSIEPVGKWNEIRDVEGLSYVDDNGNKHPFTRPVTYLDSDRAKQLSNTDSSASSPMNQNNAATGW